MDVRELDIDLIDRINPFGMAYAILAKSMSEQSLRARMLEKTDTKQGARFRKGQSGNPSGRPRGARNKTTLAVEALLDGEAEVGRVPSN
jgi:Family of unknown function (DUF5681)